MHYDENYNNDTNGTSIPLNPMELIMNQSSISNKKQQIIVFLQGLLQLIDHNSESLKIRIEKSIEKLQSLRFQVAIVGEFSSGKSSFLNALFEQEVLPTALEECTAVITRLRQAKQPEMTITVRYKNGKTQSITEQELEQVLTFESNNSASIHDVEILLPTANIFYEDVDFIDTPGVNDPDGKGDEITLQWLPQSDAIIFLTHCEQSFKKSEMAFLQHQVSQQDAGRFIFVIHAADLIENDADFKALQTRFQDLLQEKYPTSKAYFVSSHQALDALEEGNLEELASSGIPTIRKEIEQLILRETGEKQIQQWQNISLQFRDEIEKILTTNLRNIEIEEDLRQSIVQRKKDSIVHAQKEHQILKQMLNQGIQNIRNSTDQLINEKTSTIRKELNQIKDSDAQQVFQNAQNLTQDNSRELISQLQSQTRGQINELQQMMSQRVAKLLGDIESDFSTVSNVPMIQNLNWSSLVQVNTTVEEVERRERDYDYSSNDNNTLFGAGAGAFIGAAILGPFGFFAGAMMGTAIANDSSARSFWRTVKETVSITRASGDQTAQAIQSQVQHSAHQALYQVEQRMQMEIDSIIHEKLNNIEEQIALFEQQQQNHVVDLVDSTTLQKKIQYLQSLHF